MKSVNFVILGDYSIANDFGKKGTSTDLTLYDKKESDIIRTWIAPNGFPEKIQPLFQSNQPFVLILSLDLVEVY